MKNSFISNFEGSRKYNIRKAHVCIFVGLFVASLVCLEMTNRVFFVSQSKNLNIISAFEKNKQNLEVIFLGDSHFRKGIDTQRIRSSAFNLSFGKASYIQSYYILKHYILQMPSLKLVVIPIDQHTFSSYKTNSIDTPFFWSRYIDYSEVSRLTGRHIFSRKCNVLTILDKRLGQEYFVKNIAGSIKRFLLQEPKPPSIKDRAWADRKQSTDKEFAFSRAKYHLDGRDVYDEAILVYFDKILQMCKENNVWVVTLQMPVSKNYAERAGQYIIDKELKQMTSENPAYGRYLYRNLDFHNIYFDRDDFFYSEGDHLNPKGQEIFSKLLEKQISRIVHEISD